jgi:hypothetical protein
MRHIVLALALCFAVSSVDAIAKPAAHKVKVKKNSNYKLQKHKAPKAKKFKRNKAN